MKVRDLAAELKTTPAELIPLLGDIAPDCNASTKLGDQQLADARQAWQQHSAPEVVETVGSEVSLEELCSAADSLIIDDARAVAYREQIMHLVRLYLSPESQLPENPLLSARIRELGDRAKKRPTLLGGANHALVSQVRVVEGAVIVPAIELPAISLVPTPQRESSEPLPMEGEPLAIAGGN